MSSENKLIQFARWVLVLPGAIIGGLLTLFPLHWALQLIFSSFEPDLASLHFFLILNLFGGKLTAASIEYTLYPFIFSAFFIVIGSYIAPKHKLRTALVLFLIYIILWGVSSFLAVMQGELKGLQLQFNGRTVLAAVGAILGLIEVKAMNKEENEV